METLPSELLVQVLLLVPATQRGLLRFVSRRFRAVLERHAPLARACHVSHCVRSVDMLKWARKHGGFPWNKHTAASIARAGSLPALRWARRHDCPWDWRVTYCAAAGKHIEMFVWAVDNGCPCNEYAERAALDVIARRGNVRLLQWALHWDFVQTVSGMFKRRALRYAGQYGHVRALECLDPNPAQVKLFVVPAAAEAGRIPVLRWAMARFGSPFDVTTTRAAAGAGRLDTLRWLRQKRCPWDSGTALEAAKGGHQDTLKWAVTHGCPCHAGDCANALIQVLQPHWWELLP